MGVFFFSSRRRHTRWTGDWSSDVCSSDLASSTPPSSVKNNVWLSTTTSAERMRLRARWKKQMPFSFAQSDWNPHILGAQTPRSEQTCDHTLASGSVSKSDRLPSFVSFDHS